MSTTVHLVIREGIARLTLARPERRNAKNGAMAIDFRRGVTEALAGADVRCLVIDAQGDDFCAGADMGELLDEDGNVAQRTLERARIFHSAVLDLYRAPFPVVVGAQGAVVGGGLSFVLAADIVVASDDAHFVAAHTSLGLPADGGLTWWLPRVVGAQRASSLLLMGTPFTAQDALELGIVSVIVPREDLPNRVDEVSRALARPGAMAMKALLRSSLDGGLEDQLDAEALAISRDVASSYTQGLVTRRLRR